jgi:glycosyltransferase involved in cell wall biosynthesis
MKKVLIITYYWPPSGGAGVQRWLKFVKYLPLYNWKPIVYTVDNGDIPVEDLSLLKDIPDNTTVLKTPIWEPYDFYRKFTGLGKDEKLNTGFPGKSGKSTFKQKMAVWLRGNIFIPDARMFWIKPSVKYLKEYLYKNSVDVIVSTGPPHSLHLIALKLKKEFPEIKWVADFRDPWTNIDFYLDLNLSKWADKKHHRLELKVIEEADEVVSIGKTMNEELIEIYKTNNQGKPVEKFNVITNGFDEDDVLKSTVEKDKKFTIAHIGTIAKSRNPKILWEVLQELISEYNEFKADLELKLVGKIDAVALESIAEYGIKNNVNLIDYLPHDKVIEEQMKSRVLLLIVNNTPNAKGILTGKFFEYLATKNPILAIGPVDGDLSEIINETRCGYISGFQDKEGLKKNILSLYSDFKNHKSLTSGADIEKYSRKLLSSKMANVFNNHSKKISTTN